MKTSRSTPRDRYAQHKASAAARGIEFEFSFEEWWEIWEPHWAERGPHKDEKVMCRTHDEGPYRVGNVRIDSPKGNGGDRVLMRRRPWLGDKTKGAIADGGFKSYGSLWPKPDQAMEWAEEEYEWIPGE